MTTIITIILIATLWILSSIIVHKQIEKAALHDLNASHKEHFWMVLMGPFTIIGAIISLILPDNQNKNEK